jgi:hypothetical protein
MRQFRRGVEFSICSSDDLHWTWLADLRTADGEQLQGTVNGSRALVIKLCIAAIDETLSEMRKAPLRTKAPAPSGQIGYRLADTPPAAHQVPIAEDEAMFRDAVSPLKRAASKSSRSAMVKKRWRFSRNIRASHC